MTKSEPSFEERLEELQSIIRSMESGDMALNDMIKNFDRGMKVIKTLDDELNAAEKHMAVLTGANQIAEAEDDEAQG